MRKISFQKINKGLVCRRGGFTLVELMVSVSLFAIVMVVSIGAMLSIVDGNRKTQSLQVAMNNLNYALENMNRYIQTGIKYEVSGGGSCVADSLSGAETLTFKRVEGTQQITYVYTLGTHPNGNGGITVATPDNSSLLRAPVFLTAPEINITKLCFYSIGGNLTDNLQPAVIVGIEGIAYGKMNSTGGSTDYLDSRFRIHSSIVQRDKEI